MNINEEIGLRVKAYRKKLKFSQENIADMLGVSRVNYVNMEAGRQNWATNYIYNLCRVFRCKPTNLFPKVKPVSLKSKTVKKRVVRFTKTKKVFSKIL
jgi:DNA-binding XRE family transcriptional regulator